MRYDWNGMKQITYEEAVDRWINHKRGQIYLIYDDGTEGAAESLKEIKDHYEKYRGEFGMEVEDLYYFWIDTDYHYGDYSKPKFALIRGERGDFGEKLRETEEVIMWSRYEYVDGYDADSEDGDANWAAIDRLIEAELGFLPDYEIN